MTAMQSGSVPPPQATPPITTPPVVSAPTMAAGIEATHGPVDTPANTSGAPPASTGTTGPVAPTVVTAGPVAAPAAPVVGGSAVPAGPLPAYGSDLRPPVVAAPAVPSVPTAPVSGAPVAPSASSAPSAGGALVSPVERAASKAVAGPGLGGEPGAGDVGAGGGGGGTTPTGYLGPPPVPTSSPPTTPAGAPAKSVTPDPVSGTPRASGPAGMTGMPMVPPGALGAGAEGANKDKPVEKRVTAPAVPNGQPVKGRLTVPPSVPVKSADDKPVVTKSTRRILVVPNDDKVKE